MRLIDLRLHRASGVFISWLFADIYRSVRWRRSLGLIGTFGFFFQPTFEFIDQLMRVRADFLGYGFDSLFDRQLSFGFLIFFRILVLLVGHAVFLFWGVWN